MKKGLLFTAIVASMAISCTQIEQKVEKLEEKYILETKLDSFKKALNNPSFEFISWGEKLGIAKIRDSNYILEKYREWMKKQMEADKMYHTPTDRPLDPHVKSASDTTIAFGILYDAITVNLDDKNNTVKEQIHNDLKRWKYQFYNRNVLEWAINYADTAEYIIVHTGRKFKYKYERPGWGGTVEEEKEGFFKIN